MRNPFDPGYYESAELRTFGFGLVGENVRISKACNIVGLEQIEIRDNVRIDAFTSILAIGGRVRIGSWCHIGGQCHLSAADDLTFEDFSGTSQAVRIYTANDDYTGQALVGPMVPPHCRKLTRAPVHLGKFGVIGSGSVVLPGVTISEGCVVGANSLVTKTLEPWSVYFGSPARRLKARSKRLLQAEAMVYADALTKIA